MNMRPKCSFGRGKTLTDADRSVLVGEQEHWPGKQDGKNSCTPTRSKLSVFVCVRRRPAGLSAHEPDDLPLLIDVLIGLLADAGHVRGGPV